MIDLKRCAVVPRKCRSNQKIVITSGARDLLVCHKGPKQIPRFAHNDNFVMRTVYG